MLHGGSVDWVWPVAPARKKTRPVGNASPWQMQPVKGSDTPERSVVTQKLNRAVNQYPTGVLLINSTNVWHMLLASFYLRPSKTELEHSLVRPSSHP